MNHRLFGKLKYEDEYWRGRVELPAFAALQERSEPPLPGEAEASQLLGGLQKALGRLKEKLQALGGDAAGELFAAIEEEGGKQPGRARKQKVRVAKKPARKSARQKRSTFPISILDPGKEGPSKPQEEAFRHLKAKTEEVLQAVNRAVFRSFRAAYEDAHWRTICNLRPASRLADLAGQYAITEVEILREYLGGVSYLAFALDAAWGDEHGLMVVYHPDRRPTWTTPDGLDEVLVADGPLPDAEACEVWPPAELANALLAGDMAEARRWIKAGADINNLALDQPPPLCIAVRAVEPDTVRRLLKYGADPNLKDPDEKATPLQQARRMYRSMNLASSPRRGKLAEAARKLAQRAAGAGLARRKADLEEIIELLQAAGGK